MHIGIITGEYPPMQGGVGAYTRLLARTLAQQGQQVSVFTSLKAHAHDENIALDNRVKHWDIPTVRQLVQWTQRQQIDVLNIQYQTAAFSMSPWIHFIPDLVNDIPVVTTFHDLGYPYLFPKAGPLRDWVVQRLARQSEGAIVTNHEDIERLRGKVNATLIPIGSNILAPLPDDFDADTWRAQAGAQPGDCLLGYFGFMNRSKGVHILLESLAKLRAEDIPVHLVFIGGRTGTSDPTNEAYAEEIDDLIEALELEKHVHWTGFIDDKAVSAYLSACDVVALPFLDGASYRRGSLMAAIYHGCAIVTTQPVVTIATFRPGENMMLVPPDDRAALVGAIRRLYESPDLRDKLRDGAAKLAQRFDWTQIGADVIEFFRLVRGR